MNGCSGIELAFRMMVWQGATAMRKKSKGLRAKTDPSGLRVNLSYGAEAETGVKGGTV
jgi:hypothetical protein